MTEDEPKRRVPGATRSWFRVILRRINQAGFLLALIVAAAVGAVWFQSERGGFERRWADGDGLACGRLVSLRGRLFHQSCGLRDKFPQPVGLGQNSPLVMPADFVVGSGLDGEPVKLACGSFEIPFRDPSAGTFIGYNFSFQSNFTSSPPSRWTSDRRELVVSYWFIEALLALLVVAFVIEYVWDWIRARRI